MNHNEDYKCIVCSKEIDTNGRCIICIEKESSIQECSICGDKVIHDKDDLLSCHKCFYYFKPHLERNHVPYGKHSYKKYILCVKFDKYRTYTAGCFSDECEKYTEKTSETFYFPLVKNITKNDMDNCNKIINTTNLVNVKPNMVFQYKSKRMTYRYELKDAFVVQRVGQIKLK